MTEFVKHGRSVVPRNKDRLARFTLNKIRVIGNDRRYLFVEPFLGPVSIHPCTRTFPITCVWVEVPESNVFTTGLVLDLPYSNVRVIDRDIFDWRKREIE